MADTNAEDFIEKIEKKSDALFKAQRIIKNWTTEKWIDTKDGIPDIEFDKHTVKYIVETLAKDEKIDKQLIATIMPRLEKLNQVGSVKGADFVKQESYNLKAFTEGLEFEYDSIALTENANMIRLNNNVTGDTAVVNLENHIRNEIINHCVNKL